jgi:ribosomal protein S18 acetylase RimI-like enzyme
MIGACQVVGVPSQDPWAGDCFFTRGSGARLPAMSREQASVAIRPYRDEDRDAIVTLAPRLTEGVAAWRDTDAVALAVRGWVTSSLDQNGRDDRGVLVAVSDGCVAGFATVTIRRHFTGQMDAYIGELVVSAELERTGVGRALVNAAESWARKHGLQRITLETGAANVRARSFYQALGYAEEEVRLSKPVSIDDQAV